MFISLFDDINQRMYRAIVELQPSEADLAILMSKNSERGSCSVLVIQLCKLTQDK